MKFVFITLIFVSLQRECFLRVDILYSRVNKPLDSNDYFASMFGYQNSPRLNYMTNSVSTSTGFQPEKTMRLFDLRSPNLFNHMAVNSMSNTGSLLPERTYNHVLRLLQPPESSYFTGNSISSTSHVLPAAKTTTTTTTYIHHKLPIHNDKMLTKPSKRKIIIKKENLPIHNDMMLTKPSETKIIIKKEIGPVAATRRSKPITNLNGPFYKGKPVTPSHARLRSASV